MLRQKNIQAILGQLLLLLALLVTSIQIYRRSFADEGDIIAGGYLIYRGGVLYRDIFSHHFPLPYHWVALICSIFGPSLLVIKGSLFVFHTLVLWVAQRQSQFYLPIGMTAWIWSASGSIYFSHDLLYHNFKSVSLLACFIITLAILLRRITPQRSTYLILGGLSVIAILADPLSIYAVMIYGGALLLARQPIQQLLWIPLIVVASLISYAGFLWYTGAVHGFVEGVIRFNWAVYHKYLPFDSFPAQAMLNTARQGLHVVPYFWQDFDPLRPMDRFAMPPDPWAFTGFLFRLSVLLATIVLVGQRQWLAALFLYFFTATLMVTRGAEIFHANPFILVAIGSGMLFVFGAFTHNQTKKDAPTLALADRRTWGWRWIKQNMRYGRIGLRLIVAVMYTWLTLRGLHYIYSNRTNLSFAANYTHYQKLAAEIQSLTCHDRNVLLVYYPADPIVYFFADLRPAAGYLFMWPWVADVGQQAVITNLRQQDGIVYINTSESIWNYQPSEYLAPLLTFLEENYQKSPAGFYVSPKLAARCRMATPKK